ncbi:transporter [Pseudomonas argentinensis]|uniref:Pimeloyl-[acyl-carrier protein] methyl ester esterase n=1 Tax=Phytopseudomonas argentinensis TaxID=289370 RepID=A0A1I3I1Q4_9GAMM|nr:transporter [Pseudomonas argentinensis]KAB0547992.1 transporter [Pseudomonas argentinensis]SFI41896.1 pimeloyl-[acyl-carrier protein] methyl ester esterase [Pseudomonas argentinensis]
MTAQPLILLPGWGLGSASLVPLAEALGEHFQVSIEALPVVRQADAGQWLDVLDQRLPRGTWLGGWSLGGMLATLLAARRGADCPGLLTLASNARFTASAAWPTAMPVATFEAFREGYALSPAATLKRFAMLCSQGAGDARGLSRGLLAQAGGVDTLAGLDLLAMLDSQAALQHFEGPQLHLFAGGDALVPEAAAAAVQALQPAAAVHCIGGAPHAFPRAQATEVASLVGRFLEAWQ